MKIVLTGSQDWHTVENCLRKLCLSGVVRDLKIVLLDKCLSYSEN